MRTFLVVLAAGASAGLLAGCGAGSGVGGNSGGGGGTGQNPTTVTVKVTGATPAAIATQIGTGSFSAATLSSGSLTITIPAGTSNFAVAYACPPSTTTIGTTQYSSVMENVLEASTSDGTTFNVECPQPAQGTTGTLTGSVDASAIGGANYVGVAAGNSGAGNVYFLSGTSANFSKAMPAGTDRAAVGAYVYTSSNQLGANSVWTLAGLRNFDGVTVPGSLNSGNTVVLGASDAVTMQPITYKNLPSGYAAPTTVAYYNWAGGGGTLLSNETSDKYPAVPVGAAESGDVYSFTSTSQSSSGTPFDAVEVESWTGTGGPLTVTFPAGWTYTGPTPAALPVFSMAYTGFSGSGNLYYGGHVSWQQSTSTGYARSVVATASYLSGSTTLAVPDLSAVQGFAAPPASGTSVFWTALIGQTSYPVLEGSPTSGTASVVSSSGTYTVP